MTKRLKKVVIFQGGNMKIHVNSKYVNDKLVFNIEPVEYIKEGLDMNQFEEIKEDVFIYEAVEETANILKEIYEYNTFNVVITGFNDIDPRVPILINSYEDVCNGIDFSINDFEGLKHLIHLDRLHILDKVLKHLLSLNKKRSYNYEIYI